MWHLLTGLGGLIITSLDAEPPQLSCSPGLIGRDPDPGEGTKEGPGLDPGRGLMGNALDGTTPGAPAELDGTGKIPPCEPEWIIPVPTFPPAGELCATRDS